jgi:ProQ/FINO family
LLACAYAARPARGQIHNGPVPPRVDACRSDDAANSIDPLAMASKYVTERKRGSKDAAEQIPALREKWPLAFPSAQDVVRPLAIGSPRIIAQSMGWTVPYVLGVLAVWKGSPSYCEAVLCHGRINLDGSPNGEEPDTKAKEMAKKQLAKIAAKSAARPEVMRLANVPPSAEQLRAHVRGSLIKRRA